MFNSYDSYLLEQGKADCGPQLIFINKILFLFSVQPHSFFLMCDLWLLLSAMMTDFYSCKEMAVWPEKPKIFNMGAFMGEKLTGSYFRR